jgi:NAD-dependent dihydropyrimidine dehydrogenase PreA subunit
MLHLFFSFFFTAVGIVILKGYFRLRRFSSLTGKVIDVDETGNRHCKAVIEIPPHGRIRLTYENAGRFTLGQRLKCMWDGKEFQSVSEDYRINLLINGIVSCAVGICLLGTHCLSIG